MFAKLQCLWNRPDFRRNPVQALYRRANWRWRWSRTSEPWGLPFCGKTLLVAHTGTGALIYYLGVSEPETARLIAGLLRPGMTVFDLGAHFGEYAVLAANAVGPEGSVHCFEPERSLVSLLRRNLVLNELLNAVVNETAVSDSDQIVTFEVHSELASSSIQANGRQDPTSRAIQVPSVSLDRYCSRRAIRPDVIKMDVEGAEFLVFKGANSLLTLPPDCAPLWVFEYSLSTYERFNVEISDVQSYLARFGYHLLSLHPSGAIEKLQDALSPETRNLVATKRPEALVR